MGNKLFEKKSKTAQNPSKEGTVLYGGYAVVAPAGAAIYGVDIDKIQPNPSQPRRMFTEESISSLAESIRQYGIIQPVVVRSCFLSPEGACSYELVEGERRLRAARKLGLREMPCIIISTDSKKSAEIALTENLQREQLNMFDEANAISSFMDIYRYSVSDMAKKLACKEEDITAKLSLLRLSPEEKAAVISNKLTARHVTALLSVNGEDNRRALLRRIISEGISAESAEAIAKGISAEGTKSISQAGKNVVLMRDVKAFFNTLERAVDMMRHAGVDVKMEKKDLDTQTEVHILIQNEPQKSTRQA